MRTNLCNVLTVSAVACAALAVNTSSALANFFEFSSSIDVGATTGIASINTTNISSPGTIVLTTTNGSVVTLTANQRQTVASHLNGNTGSNANFGSIGAVPSAFATDIISIAFSYTVTLRDYAAANSPLASPLGTGTVRFDIVLFGNIGSGGVGLTLESFTATPTIPGQPDQGFVEVVGGSNYIAQPFHGSPPDGIVNGVLSSTFTVTSLPTPGAAALAGLGGAFAFGRRRRA